MVGPRMATSFGIEFPDGLVDGEVELVGVAEGAVGQVVALQVAPGALDVVQLRRVLRQPLDREPGPRGERPPARLARVDRAVVERQHHRLEHYSERGPIAPDGPELVAREAGLPASVDAAVLSVVDPGPLGLFGGLSLGLRGGGHKGNQGVPHGLLNGIFGGPVECHPVDDRADDHAPAHKLADGVTNVLHCEAPSDISHDDNSLARPSKT